MPHRIAMIVPSLNTIAEDDFRLFCPPEVGYHVHRVRLRSSPGRVTMDDLIAAYGKATEAGRVVCDLRPTVVAFNCTGASVAKSAEADSELAQAMTEALGVPSTNTMQAIKHALGAVGGRAVVHVSPFADEFSKIEQRSLEAAGVRVINSVGLGFADARVAAQMDPKELADIAQRYDSPEADALLLSCANVRAFEATERIEQTLGKPVISSNQAMLWDALHLAGWKGVVAGAGRLFSHPRR